MLGFKKAIETVFQKIHLTGYIFCRDINDAFSIFSYIILTIFSYISNFDRE